MPLWQLSDTQVEDALADSLAAEARLTARRAELLREADLRALRDRTRASSTERWLRDRFRLSPRDAAARVREADLVVDQPAVLAALSAGRLTAEQAGVVATAMDQVDHLDAVTDDERQQAAGFLLDQATALDPRGLATAGRAVVEHLTRTPTTDDPAEAAALARELAAADAGHTNTLTLRRLPDGSVRGRFTLRPVDAPALTTWLRQADQPHPGTDGFTDHRPRDQRRGDHLAAALRAAPSTATGQRPAEARVLVTTTLQDLRDGRDGTGTLDTGGTLTPAELRRLACDAGIVPAVLGGASELLDLGRTRRDFSPAQRRALVIRDRGCSAPGCDRAPADCHAHHQTEWTHHGPTDLANAALLCGFHHQQVHRQGWRVALAPNGCPHLIPPPTIDPQQRPRQHHRYRLTLLTGRQRT